MKILYHDSNKEHPAKLFLCAESAELFRTASGRGYARVPVGEHREVYAIDSSGFRAWLHFEYYRSCGLAAIKREMDDAVFLLEAKARYEGVEERVFCRVAELDGRKYLDLGGDTREALEIEQGNWRVVPQPANVRFIRPLGFLELPKPVSDPRAPVRFQELFRLSDEQFRIVVAWLLQAFYLNGHPTLFICGEGALLFGEELCRLVDPRSVAVRAAPREQSDLMIGAAHEWVVVLYVRKMTKQVLDGISNLTTGAGLGRRRQYADEEEVVFSGRHPIILLAEREVGVDPEIADLVCTVELPSLVGTERKLDSELRSECDQIRAGLLAYLAEAVSLVLMIPDCRPASLPVHGEFAALGERAEVALDWPLGSFRAAYANARLAGFPASTQVLQLGLRRRNWHGSATELLDEIQLGIADEVRDSPGWPKDAAQLGKELRRSRTLLLDLGLNIIFWRYPGGDRQRTIILESNQR